MAIKTRGVKLIAHWGEFLQCESEFFVCVGCGKVLSRSGFYHHRGTFYFTDDKAKRRFCFMTNNTERFIERVKSVFERRFHDGRLRGRANIFENDGRNPSITFPLRPAPCRSLPRVSIPRHHIVVHSDEDPHTPQTPIEDPLVNRDEFLQFDDFDEGLPLFDDSPEMMSCFSTAGFDPNCFAQFAQNIFREMAERDERKDTIEKEKAKIVSTLAQN